MGNLKYLHMYGVEAHDVDILNSLILPCLIMETHGLGSTYVQGITGTQQTLLHCYKQASLHHQTHIPIAL